MSFSQQVFSPIKKRSKPTINDNLLSPNLNSISSPIHCFSPSQRRSTNLTPLTNSVKNLKLSDDYESNVVIPARFHGSHPMIKLQPVNKQVVENNVINKNISVIEIHWFDDKYDPITYTTEEYVGAAPLLLLQTLYKLVISTWGLPRNPMSMYISYYI